MDRVKDVDYLQERIYKDEKFEQKKAKENCT